MRSDRGLGMIEIIISMVLIALIAIAFAPVVLAAIRASETNSTVATAVRLVSQGIDRVRAAGPTTCDALADLGSVETVTDARGQAIQLTVTVPDADDCSAAEPQLVRAVVRVVGGSTEPIAEARLLIALGGAP